MGYTVNCYAQPSSGVWHHLAVVYDKSKTGASAVSFYLDGVQQTAKLSPYTSKNTNAFGNNPTYLFSRGGASEFNAGMIDDMRIYNWALTAAEIQRCTANSNGWRPAAELGLTTIQANTVSGCVSSCICCLPVFHGRTAPTTAQVHLNLRNAATLDGQGLKERVPKCNQLLLGPAGSTVRLGGGDKSVLVQND